MILETNRLILKKLEESDFESLRSLLQSSEAMYAYEGPFNDREVREWFDRQQTRYTDDGFGLWSVIRKADERFIGQCGITLQSYRETRVPEIGYLLCPHSWHAGFATEAASACRQFAFGTLGMKRIYSFIRDTNLPSQRVSLRIGMRQIDTICKRFRGIDMPHFVFRAEQTESQCLSQAF